MIFEGEWTKQLREARLYLITGSGLIAVCGSLCTRSLACHPQATNPQRVQELLEPYRTNCRCFWWISHVRTVRVWLVAWRVSAQLKSVVLFVFCESEFMETDLLINSDVANAQLSWLISCFCRLHYNHCISLSSWRACDTAGARKTNYNLLHRQ